MHTTQCIAINARGDTRTGASWARHRSQTIRFRIRHDGSSDGPPDPRLADEQGVALVVALIGLALLSLVGIYMTYNASTELRIGDNYESAIQAGSAARAGLNHAREVIRGVPFDALLKGPDNTAESTASYLSRARTFAFRNPLSLSVARSLNVLDPGLATGVLPDDGLVNTGLCGTTPGTPLIGLNGIALSVPDPSGTGSRVASRYFVKVTDNNGEASELAKDPADSPFADGDGIIIVRSLGISGTIGEITGISIRRNSVSVVEGRFKQRSTFDLDAPLVVQGSTVLPAATAMFEGTAFRIDGKDANPGIATIDLDDADGIAPSGQVSSRVASDQRGNIRGIGGYPSIADVTASVLADPDKALLLKPDYLHRFITVSLPQFADNVLQGTQEWPAAAQPDLGVYDIGKPATDPSQRPLVTMVDGDLRINGSVSGGGLLVVRGSLRGSGILSFNGLILAAGAGVVDLSGLSLKLNGGIYLASIQDLGETRAFDTPRLTVGGSSEILFDGETVRMGVRLIPPIQLGWREIASTMDP